MIKLLDLAMLSKLAQERKVKFAKEHPRQMEIMALLKKWHINKTYIAKVMGMKQSSFMNKGDYKQERFNFTDHEIDRMIDIIFQLSDDLKRSCPPKLNK